jgi:hypothetical protein
MMGWSDPAKWRFGLWLVGKMVKMAVLSRLRNLRVEYMVLEDEGYVIITRNLFIAIPITLSRFHSRLGELRASIFLITRHKMW